MSFGPSAMRFEVKHGAKGGIFWQKEPAKQKPRKFGYKSKVLRHPVRRVEPEYIEEPVQKAKPSTDFIRKNREQFGQNQREEEKENYHGSSSAGRPSSEIKPGTVTLTQDQLNALLASVGKFKPGEADGLRISIDADSNQLKIDSPQLNSRGMDNGHRRNGDYEERSIPGLSREADNDDRVKAKNRRNTEKGVRFDSARNEVQHMKPEPQQTPLPPAPLVPWKHMTVAERKRLQWAREKAAEEAVGTFDPWGRPGAGAPPKKQEPNPPETQLHTTEDKHLRKAIDDIEAKYSALLAQAATRESPAVKISPRQEDDRQSYPRATNDDAYVRVSQDSHLHMEDRGNARPSKKQSRTDELKERKGGQRKGNRRRAPSREEEKGVNREERGQAERRKERDEREFMGMKTETAEIVTRGNMGLPASMQTSMLIGQVAPDNSQYLSKKEEEKKRWIEELDRQREEKRLQKQRERDAQRAGGDDLWADRFVQEPPPRPSIRMQAQQPTSTQQLLAPDAPASAPTPAPRSSPAPASTPYSVGQAYGYEARRNESSLSRARTDSQNQEMPPAAMRSSMMIGAIAPNDDRIRSKKEEEKKMWLDELNKQREEQREARVKLNNRQRASEETWADRFTQDPRTAAVTGVSSHQVPGLETQPPAGYYDNAAGRVNSAPQPQPTSMTSTVEDEQATFLRGQNVYMDPVTRNELEQKRRTHLEYQAAVKAQIEEKERLKREERESKWRDEMEEETKLRAERDQLQRQLEAEENKHKQREDARQKQVEHLKHMMDKEQERAKEERMINRLKTLQQAGHDVRGLKAHYEATTPTIHGMSVDPSSIPGLGGTSPRDNYYPNPPSYRAGTHNQEISTGRINHDPYTEGRVLTPSRLRKPSQPHSDPLSPRREFATQTADDIAVLIEGLKKQISDVEIEYRAKPGDRPTNSSKAGQRPPAPKKPGDNQQRPAAPPAGKPTRQKQQQVADGKPPKWNYQNPKKKAPVKQSEKDPFYEQKRQESEDRRARRERQLQYLVELNKQVIPTEKHSRLNLHPSDGAGDGNVPNGYHSERVEAEASPRRKRETDGPSHNERSVEKGDVSRSRSPPARNDGKYRRGQTETDRRHNDRSQSPPVPAVRHKVGMNPAKDFESDYNVDAHNYSNYNGNQEATPRVDEHGNVRAPVRDTDFVPIMRTQDILDPSRADEPVQLSRENTHIKIARQHYHENLRPADYGNQLQMYEDRQRQPVPRPKDPILNPGLVKDFPTARQDQILQQLSSLKQSLIQRQRELETCMSPSDLEKQL